MRAFSRILFAASLATGLVLTPGCKQTGDSKTTKSVAPAKPRRTPGMPKPYRLPAKPELAVYVAAPAEAIAASAAYAPGVLPSYRALIQKALADTPSDFDKRVAVFIDTKRAWAATSVDGHEILWLPISAGKNVELASLLAPLAPEGKFGAVKLKRTGPGAKLAWFDKKNGYIALADDLRGIATARTLPHEYGKDGLFVAISAEQAKRFTGQSPFSRVEIKGAGPHDFTLSIDDTDTSNVPGLGKITEGALTGMLSSKQIALGVSTKYKGHAGWVKKELSSAKRTISKQNFLVRGNLENLHRRAGSMLRSWNGRVLVGVGPSRHLLLAFGSADAGKMGASTHRLIEGVRDNISMARQFGINIPKVRFAKSKMTAAGHNIAVVAIQSAKKVVPKEYWNLLDDRGELRIAMAFSKRAGGGMVTIGGSAEKVLGTWLEQIKKAPAGADTVKDLAAATFAVDTKTMASLGNGDLGKVASKLLSLSAKQAPTSVVVRRDDARYEITVQGPRVKPLPPARAASANRGARAPSRAAGRSGGKSRSPGRGKPVRAPSRPKPTHG